MVGYFRNCRQGDRIIESVLFDLVSRPELVPWLQEQIVEQKRIDAETSGTVLSHSQSPARSKSSDPMPDVQLILPGDARKQRKQTKQIFLEKGESQCVDWASPDTYSLSAMLQRLK
jgi:translation initiation factor 2-alpha kinase 4